MEYGGEGDKGTKDAGEEKGREEGRTKETEECNGHSRREERRTIGPLLRHCWRCMRPGARS
jgi:hypothetical protein